MFEKQMAYLTGLLGLRGELHVDGMPFLPRKKVRSRQNRLIRSIRGRNTSKYMPHQGKRECQRRINQGLAPAAL